MTYTEDPSSGIKEAKAAKNLVMEAKKAFLKAKQDGVFKGDTKNLAAIRDSIDGVIENLNKLVKTGDATSSSVNSQLDTVKKTYAALNAAVNTYVAKTSENSEKLAKSLTKWGDAAAAQSLKSKLIIASTGGVANALSKYGANLTVAYQAQKLFTKIQESARLQQDLLTQANMGLNVSMRSTSDSSKFAGVGVSGLAGEMLDTTKSAAILGEGLAKARASAAYFGIATEEAAEQFKYFAEITGEVGKTQKSVDTLERLTSASFAVSRAMGISASEAANYTATRLEKFGGSAEGSVVSLKMLYDQAEDVNNTFGRTVVKSRDVARAIEDMSRESTTFAFDQRFAGNVMTQNMMRLTAMGASYEEAKQKAKAYLDVTMGDKAPEWMKILAGEGILTNFLKASHKGWDEFNKQFGKSLDAAHPGLSKKVFDILEDGTLNMYEKGRLVQELTRGTTVGALAMNKQILSLYDQSGQSLTVLSQQMGISHEQAYEIVQMAKASVKNEKLTVDLMKDSAEKLSATLGISLEKAQQISELKDKTAKKEQIAALLQEKDKKGWEVKAAVDRVKKNRDALKQYKIYKENIKKFDLEIAEAKANNDERGVKFAEEEKKKEQEKASTIKITAELPAKEINKNISVINEQMNSIDKQLSLKPGAQQEKALQKEREELAEKRKVLEQSAAEASAVESAREDLQQQALVVTQDIASRTAASSTLLGNVYGAVKEFLSGPLGTAAGLAAAIGLSALGGPTVIAKGIEKSGLITAIENAFGKRATFDGDIPPPSTKKGPGGGGGITGGLKKAGAWIKGNKGKTALIAAATVAAAYGGYKFFGGGAESTAAAGKPGAEAPKEGMGLGAKAGIAAATLAGTAGLAFAGKKLLKTGLKAGLKSLPGVGNLLTAADIIGGGIADIAGGASIGRTLAKSAVRGTTALLPVGAGMADLAVSEGFDALFSNKGVSTAAVTGIGRSLIPAAARGLAPTPSGSPFMGGGDMMGSFGNVMPDGSVQITIQNFLSALGQAQNLAASAQSAPTRKS